MRFLSAVIFLAYLAGFIAFKQHTDMLSTQIYPANVDAAVLFTGGNGRLEVGSDYLQTFPNKALLITGVHPKITMDILLKEGIIPAKYSKQVQLDYEARDTFGNVNMVKVWANKNKFNIIRFCCRSIKR